MKCQRLVTVEGGKRISARSSFGWKGVNDSFFRKGLCLYLKRYWNTVLGVENIVLMQRMSGFEYIYIYR